MDRFLRNSLGLLLAYDQGFEHGPADFDAKNVDPAYIIELGALAVGYTVYVGSEYEYKMTRTLGDIVRQCNQLQIPTIAWMYLRGKHISDPHDRKKLAYAARLGLELGADAVKLQFQLSGHSEQSEESRLQQDINDLRWIVQNAGKCKVFISGGSKIPDDQILQLTKVAKTAAAAGMAIGRNVWQ